MWVKVSLKRSFFLLVVALLLLAVPLQAYSSTTDLKDLSNLQLLSMLSENSLKMQDLLKKQKMILEESNLQMNKAFLQLESQKKELENHQQLMNNLQDSQKRTMQSFTSYKEEVESQIKALKTTNTILYVSIGISSAVAVGTLIYILAKGI